MSWSWDANESVSARFVPMYNSVIMYENVSPRQQAATRMAVPSGFNANATKPTVLCTDSFGVSVLERHGIVTFVVCDRGKTGEIDR